MLKTALITPIVRSLEKPKPLLWKVYEPFSPYSKNLNYNKKLAEINNNG